MGLERPLEGLLRPPLEWYTTAVASVSALLLVTQWQNFFMPEGLAKISAGCLGLLAAFRFKQGYRIWRYQRQLKRMPTYTMSSRQLPVSRKRLFLGKGFLWTSQHSQRLRFFVKKHFSLIA